VEREDIHPGQELVEGRRDEPRLGVGARRVAQEDAHPDRLRDATARPPFCAYIAARMAASVLFGHPGGQRRACRPRLSARASTSAIPCWRASVSAHEPPPVTFQIPPRRIGCQIGTTGSTLLILSAARYA
jgi:hypothetical protein